MPDPRNLDPTLKEVIEAPDQLPGPELINRFLVKFREEK